MAYVQVWLQGIYIALSVTSYINCIVAHCLINVVYLTACCLYQVMMTLHFLSDVANDAESTQKWKIISARLWERMLNRSASLTMSTSVLKALPGKLDIKKTLT